MLYETKGIFLHSIKYSETSMIIKVYTESFGIKSYLLKGAYRKKSAIKANIFNPLCNLNIIGYTNKNSQLNFVKEISVSNLLVKSYGNIYKSSILLFLNEMLYNCLKEGEINKDLYEYILDSLFKLEEKEDEYFNFHLAFLVNLTMFLGIQPQNNYSEHYRFFNFQEGVFENMQKPGQTESNQKINKLFSLLLDINYENLDVFRINSSERRELLNFVIEYYKRHISGFKDIKSHKILETILS